MYIKVSTLYFIQKNTWNNNNNNNYTKNNNNIIIIISGRYA